MTNFETLQNISSNELIRDKSVLEIAISCKEGIKILLKFDPTPHGDIVLEFSNVKSFNLQGDKEFDLNGILVSHYKLFLTESQDVYFSFDPYGELNKFNDKDNNYIIAEEIFLVRG